MIYRFADCALHTQLFTLHREGQRTRLPPKVFEVLCYLIEHRDHVVSKQELCDQVWEGYAISDATLESCLRAARLTVGDSGQAQRIIQTQRGYGYRFVADVEIVPEDMPTPSLPPAAVTPPLTSPVGGADVRLCTACHYTNPEEATFCARCGIRLRQLCPHCGQHIALPAVFCVACGQPLAPLPSPDLTTITTEPAHDCTSLESHTIPSCSTPETDRADIAAQIDHLPPMAQSLLQTAAVIGVKVSFPLLQAVTEFSAEMLSCSFAHLQTAGWLTEERRLPELVYIFSSPLAQEVVYETLPQEQRRMLHAQVAAALAELYSDCVEDMANHAFRGEVWDKAVVYCRQAGEQAAANTTYRQAVTYFEQGLASIQHLPAHHDTHTQMIDLQLHLSNALMAVGDLGRVIAPLCAAESLADTLDDGRRLGRACSLLTFAYWLAGDYQRAIAPGRRAIAIARVLDDFAPLVRATLFLGQVYLALGKYAQAEDCFRQNIACLTEELRHNLLGMPGFPAVLSRAWLAWGLAELGAFTEGQTYCEEAMQVAEAVQHPFSLAVACCSAGVVSLYKGEYRKATRWLECGLAFCQGEELPIWFPWIAACLGAAYAGGGRVAAALPLLEQAIERATDMGLMGYQARRLAWLGEAYLVAGRMPDALKCAERALTLACELQESSSQAQALWLRAELAARCVPPEREAAETAYHQARSLAQELGMRPLVAHCHLGLGTLYDWLGEPESAHLELSTAVELFQSMDMAVWLSRAKAALPRLM